MSTALTDRDVVFAIHGSTETGRPHSFHLDFRTGIQESNE